MQFSQEEFNYSAQKRNFIVPKEFHYEQDGKVRAFVAREIEGRDKHCMAMLTIPSLFVGLSQVYCGIYENKVVSDIPLTENGDLPSAMDNIEKLFEQLEAHLEKQTATLPSIT